MKQYLFRSADAIFALKYITVALTKKASLSYI